MIQHDGLCQTKAVDRRYNCIQKMSMQLFKVCKAKKMAKNCRKMS